MIKKRKTIYKAPSADKFAAEAMFYSRAASANDCTGMTPTPPLTEDEAESYCDVLSVPVTSKDGGEAYENKNTD